MVQENEEVHVTAEDARAGATGQGVRYVLVISLVLVLVALGALFFNGTRGPERAGTAPAASEAPLPTAT